MGYDIPHVLAATWSLAIEEHFYLILPALIAITTRSQLAAAIAGFVVLAFLLRSGVYLFGINWADAFSYYFTFCRLDELMLGVGAALIVRHRPSVFSSAGYWRLRYVLIAAFLGIVALSVPLLNFPWVMNTIGFLFYTAFYFALLLIAVCEPRSPVAMVTANPILRWLGVRAYSIYLFHQPILVAIMFYLPAVNGFAQRSMALFSVLSLAWVLWRFVEAPLIAVGHRVKYGEAIPS